MFYAVVCDCGGWDHRHEFDSLDDAEAYMNTHLETHIYQSTEIAIYDVQEIVRVAKHV